MKKLYTGVFILMVLLSMSINGTAIDSVPIMETAADGGYFDKYLPVTETNDGAVSVNIYDGCPNYPLRCFLK